VTVSPAATWLHRHAPRLRPRRHGSAPLFLYLAMWELGEELGDDDIEHLVAEGGEDGGEVVPELEEKLCGDVWI
jgi:hypothetical protein